MIPDWVVIKKLDEINLPKEQLQLDMEEWPRIARERINNFVQNKRWYPIRNIYSERYERELFEEFAGHALLRLVAAENSRVFGWLIEQEGDLFEWRFMNAKGLQEKIEIMNYFFGDENVYDPKTLWSKFDRTQHYFKDFLIGNRYQETIAVHFSCVPKMVSNRSALLVNGWVFGTINDFANSIKRKFEKMLRDRIKETGEKMDRTARSAVREIQEELGKIIYEMAKSSGKVDMSIYDFYHRQDLFPQCMLDLYNEVMSKGHLGHNERFQLGLFLKKMGMPLQEQMRFWYRNAVDNAGISFDQFERGNAGYIIRHMYGLEGGETDYNAPGCERIQGEYYCTFLHQSIDKIDKNIRKEFENPSKKEEDLIRELERKVIDKKPSEACAILFKLRYGWKAYPIRHPISYAKYAAKAKKLLTDNRDKIKGQKIENEKR
ncbi:MAG: hypothetical protein U9O98_08660 [Asgard group archaeon]|nr:hypothetical protein [Asgard group archaeon]